MIKKIFFDMDGILADFDRGVEELCHMAPQDVNGKRDSQRDDEMWHKIKEVGHFYDKLEMMPGAKEMFDQINSQYPGCCEILTGIPKAKRGITTAGEDKTNWVRRLLSKDIKVNIVYREEKPRYCSGTNYILIDDSQENIDDWIRFGGTGILHKSAEETIANLKELSIL